MALGGTALGLFVKCSKTMVDLDMMHKNWLTDPTVRYKKYYPEYVGSAESMKWLRVRSSGWVESKALINLPLLFNHIS